MSKAKRFPDEPLPPTTHGVVATWWDATLHPRELAGSLARGEPRVSAALYVLVAMVARGAIVAGVTHLQMSQALELFGAADTLDRLFRIALLDSVLAALLSVSAILVAVVFFAFVAKRTVREVLRVRAYGMGPVSYIYAWWVLYRWLREVSPGARRPEAWALMAFTLEWGLAVALGGSLLYPMRDAVLDWLPWLLAT